MYFKNINRIQHNYSSRSFSFTYCRITETASHWYVVAYSHNRTAVSYTTGRTHRDSRAFSLVRLAAFSSKVLTCVRAHLPSHPGATPLRGRPPVAELPVKRTVQFTIPPQRGSVPALHPYVCPIYLSHKQMSCL